MFQDALFESPKKLSDVPGRSRQGRTRYLSLLSIGLNGSALLLLLLWPVLHLEPLPKQALSNLVVAPAPPVARAPSVRTTAVTTMPRLSKLIVNPVDAPVRMAQVSAEDAPPSLEQGALLDGQKTGGVGRNFGDVIGAAGQARAVVPAPASPPRKVTVSSGVMAGARLAGQDPTYPAVARQARIQGTVVLAATISRTGVIENLRFVSGPAMLTGAAIDAVKNWRYKPFLLNGQPVEIETEIHIVFNLGY